MPKVKVIDIARIFRKASGHPLPEIRRTISTLDNRPTVAKKGEKL